MPRVARVEIGPAGLQLVAATGAVQARPLLCGAMHYFQHPRASWDRCLDRLAELGLSIVDTCVPWTVHEREPGSFVFDADSFADRDLGGSTAHACRNLAAFLEACQARGLLLLLRVGPQVSAELTGFGYPLRILGDEGCQARGAAGNPVIMPAPPRFFPMPSYASERFLAEAEGWLAALGAFLAPWQWPDGPVVALQLESGLTLFFRDGAYDQDYHPDAVTGFRRFVAERYAGGAAASADPQLPAGYREPLATLQPPRRMDATSAEELVPHLDWLDFRESVVLGALRRLGDTLRAQGITRVPLTHHVPATPFGASFSLAAGERVLDLSGIDLHLLQARDYASAKRTAQHAAGSSRLPFLAELAWGGRPWWSPQTIDDQLSIALAALMHGVRGLSFHMAVERDRWFGAPITADGEPRGDRFEATRRLVAALRDSRLPELPREVAVAVMRVPAYRRLSRCASLIDPLPPLLLSLLRVGPCEYASRETFGLAAAVQCEHHQFGHVVEEVLADLRVDYHILDAEVSPEALARYRLLVLPTFDFIRRPLLARLSAYVAAGGTLAIGPFEPSLDEAMQPLGGLALPEHALLGHESVEVKLAELVDRLGIAPALSCDRDAVELTCYGSLPDPSAEAAADRGAAAAELVIFAANRGDTSCTTAIRGLGAPRGLRVWDAMSGTPVDLGCLHLEAQQVRMLLVRGGSPGDEGGRR